MKRVQLILGSFLFAVSIASLTQAQQRTFVSGGGVDGNPCTRIAPCRTFGQALSLTSPGGEIVVLDSAGYGAFAVTQSVSIIVAPGVYAGISVFTGDGIDINAGPGDTVILRGLTITNQGSSGSGIVFNTGATLHVESCDANGFTSFGGGHLGSAGLLFVPTAAATLEVKDSTFKNNNHGICTLGSSGTAKVAIDGVRFEGNAGGLLADAGSSVTVRDSLASGGSGGFSGANNPGTGNAPTELNLENCLAIGQGFDGGVEAGSTGGGTVTVRVSNSTVIGGGFFIFAGPAVLLSRVNNTVEPGTAPGTYSAK
jgi:hypothetical protein